MKRRIGCLVLAGALLVGSVIPSLSFATGDVTNPDSNPPVNQEEVSSPKYLKVTRIKGGTRYETAVEVSKSLFTEPAQVDYVAIATGEDFVDGLVGGTLTAQEKFPLLLTKKNEVSQEVLDEIKRLKPKQIFIYGGEGAVSKEVENKIKEVNENVVRLAGRTRFDTAREIGAKRAELKNLSILNFGDKKHFVNAHNFADSLSAAPYLARATESGGDVYPLMPYMEGQEAKEAQIIFGGEGAVVLAGKTRIAGKNRYETAIEVAKAYNDTIGVTVDTIVLVSGKNYPDGLASASVAAMSNGAVLLTDPVTLPPAVKKYIEDNKNIINLVIIGGENAVSSGAEKELKKIEVQEAGLPTD